MIKNFPYRQTFVALTLFLILFCSTGLTAEEEVLRLGYSDSEAYPYQLGHEKNPPGIAFEIISEAAKKTGIKVIFIALPNKRVQASLKEGNIIDGAFMFSYSSERTLNGVYPEIKGVPDGRRRIATLSYYIYRKKGSPLNWDGNSFSGIDKSDIRNSIGANTGYSVVQDLKKMGVHVDDGSRTTQQNFLKLQSGRISGFAHQDLVADNYLLLHKITDIEKLPRPFIQKHYYLMISRQYYSKNRETAERLWDEIARIRDRKTAEIMHKYTE